MTTPRDATAQIGIIDAWMQIPCRRFLTDDIFHSLHRWNRTPLEILEDDNCPAYQMGTVLQSLDSGGVEKALISAWYGPQGPLITNEQVLEACHKYPDRFFGVASADIRNPVQALREIRKCFTHAESKQHFKAVRVLPWLWGKPPDDKLFYPIYAECVSLRVPICLQVGQTGPLRPSEMGRPIPYLENVLLDFPDLVVVGGHIGDPWTREMIFLCGKFPNLYIDTSAYTPERFPPELVEYMKSMRGRKRVLYGSNYPMIQHVSISKQIDPVLNLDEEAKRLFLHKNAERVFKLTPGTNVETKVTMESSRL